MLLGILVQERITVSSTLILLQVVTVILLASLRATLAFAVRVCPAADADAGLAAVAGVD